MLLTEQKCILMDKKKAFKLLQWQIKIIAKKV